MKITFKGDYALKTILDLSFNYPDKLAHIEDIAKRQDIPKKFLEQILAILKKGGFITSKKGPNGGYKLAKHPSKIWLGEVIRLIDGPTYPISCVDNNNPKKCDFQCKCAFFDIWKDIDKTVSDIVDNINFEELKKRTNKLTETQHIMYHI